MFRITRYNPKIWLALAICLILVVAALAGCSNQATAPTAAQTSPTPTSTPTPITAQEIVDKTLNAMSKLTTAQYSLSLDGKISMNISDQPGDMVISASGQGLGEVATYNMQFNLQTEIETSNLQTEIETSNQTKMSFPMAYYRLDGWQYIKIAQPFKGEQWVKMKISAESPAATDYSVQGLEMLKSAMKVSLKGIENVEDVACYVLEIQPDLGQIGAWLESILQTANLPPEVVDSEFMKNLDLAKFVKNLSIKEAVIKDSFLLKKLEISAVIVLNAVDFGETQKAGESVTLDITQTLLMGQYNQPVSISLPPEAAGAKDVSEMMPKPPVK